MIRTVISIVVITLAIGLPVGQPPTHSAATCVGATPCKACTNCKSCGFCAKRGGKCGTCKKHD